MGKESRGFVKGRSPQVRFFFESKKELLVCKRDKVLEYLRGVGVHERGVGVPERIWDTWEGSKYLRWVGVPERGWST